MTSVTRYQAEFDERQNLKYMHEKTHSAIASSKVNGSSREGERYCMMAS
jgi:hypothetical protein